MPCCRRLAVFAAPAIIDLVKYDLAGERMCADGAVIYEGMEVELNSNGRYSVRFSTTLPDRPLTMFLQLQILVDPPQISDPKAASDTRLPRMIGAEPSQFTLTLPPIVIRRNDESSAIALGLTLSEESRLQSHQVTHEGFSWLVAQNYAKVVNVTRSGSARWERTPAKLFGDPLTSIR